MSNIQFHVDQLYERGYTALPAFFSEDDCAQMREIMDDFWRSQGSPSLAGAEFGFTIHPMMARVPRMAPFFERDLPNEIMRAALGEEPRLVHMGARVSGPSSVPRIPWHHHYGNFGDYGWNADDLLKRTRLERILSGVYVDGTLPESGPFITLPRRFNDPLSAPKGDIRGAWEGEQKVEMPPGSVAIFDTALWHAAAKGTGTSARRLWGGHYQGQSETRAHPEDNEVNSPEIADQLEHLPRLRALIGEPAKAL